MDFRARKAASLEADKVQTDQPRAIAHGGTIGDHIRLNPAHAAKYRLAADAHELMNGRAAADKNRIGDFHMPTQHDVIGENNAIRQAAIMRYMRHRHDQAIRADARDPIATDTAAMDGGVFADECTRADLTARWFILVFQILRRHADGGEGKYLHACTKARMPIHNHMRNQFNAIFQHHIRADDAARTNLAARANFGGRRNYGGRVNFGHAQRSRIMAA